MHVYVVDTFFDLSAKTRRVEVVDVRDSGVEDIEHVQHEACLVRESISGFRIPQRRVARLDVAVFNQRTRTEVTDTKAAEDRLAPVHRQSSRDDSIERTRHEVAGRIVVGESRVRPREIGIDGQPWPYARVVGLFQPDPPAGASRPCCTCVTHKEKL